ncbi:MAG: hypothetical protein NXH82_04995 [Rhodobacteraceae bacterium]|nr:hypothetical protein [Paracoccaceae bacterium]
MELATKLKSQRQSDRTDTFRVPEWILDYCLVGSIVAGGAWRKKWVEPKGFSIEEVPLNVRADIWWYRRRQEAKGFLFGLALWPLLVPVLLIGPFVRYPEINTTEASFTLADGSKPEPIVQTSAQVSMDRLERLLYTLARFIGFIPFLFVTSTLLYRFG